MYFPFQPGLLSPGHSPHPTLTLSSMTSNQLMGKKNPLLIAPAGDIIITSSLAVKVLDWPLNTLAGPSVLPVPQFPASPVRCTNLEQERWLSITFGSQVIGSHGGTLTYKTPISLPLIRVW